MSFIVPSAARAFVRTAAGAPALAIAIAIALGGCASAATTASGDTFPAEPLSTTASDSGFLTIELRTSPSQPPPRGTCSVELRVLDAKKNPLDGLTLDVEPFMPAMGHGGSVVPSVSAKGDGRYLVTNVSFYMPGSWQLRISIHGAAEDHAAPSVDVP